MQRLESNEKEALLNIALKIINDIENKAHRDYAWTLYEEMQLMLEDEDPDEITDIELMFTFYQLFDFWWLHND